MALSVHNTDVLLNLAAEGFPQGIELYANSATTQAAATPLIGAVNVVRTANANQSFVLPQTQPGGSGSPSPLYHVINDSANTIVVFVAVAASGNVAEAMTTVSSGTATTTNNGSMSIPAGMTGVFHLVNTNRQARGGGVQNTSNVQLGWSRGLIG